MREIRPGDGAAIARIHLENSAYYERLEPRHFQQPDADGLAEFLEPGPDENSRTTLAIVAELDGELAGSLYAHLEPPHEDARFQSPSSLRQTRLFVDAVGTSQRFWRHGVARRLVEEAERWGRARGATLAECDTWPESPVSIPFWEDGVGYTRRSVRLQKRL